MKSGPVNLKDKIIQKSINSCVNGISIGKPFKHDGSLLRFIFTFSKREISFEIEAFIIFCKNLKAFSLLLDL